MFTSVLVGMVYTQPVYVSDVFAVIAITILVLVIRKGFIETTLAGIVLEVYGPKSLKSNPQIQSKFRLSFYKMCSHFIQLTIGYNLLSRQEYFYDMKLLWIGAPFHKLTRGIYWYYMLQFSYYLSEATTHFLYAARRKDFYQMFIHHIITIILISSSYVLTAFRVGTLVMYYHDMMDPFLETSKVLKYLEKKRLCNAMFALLMIVFLYSRLYVYPLYIIYGSIFDIREHYEAVTRDPIYIAAQYIIVGLLLVLLALNAMWGYFIGKTLYNSLRYKQELNDARSDDEHVD